jgi:hypothetical protein
VIWVAKVELPPKLNFTVSPGWAASNCFPSWVKVPISDAAANTVIVPVCVAEPLLAADEDELAGLEAGLEELLLEQPATAIAASATAVRAKRRMFNSLVSSSRADQLVRDAQRRRWRRPPCPPRDCPRRAAVQAGGFKAATGIITRTLPLIVAGRKEFRHHFGDSCYRRTG